MIGKWIYSTLSSHSGVTGMVGVKIFPVAIPETSELPAVAYRLASARGNTAKGHASYIDVKRYDVAVYCMKYDDPEGGKPVWSIAEEIRSALELPNGASGAGVSVIHSEYVDERDGYDSVSYAYVRTLTFEIWIDKQ